MADIITTEVPRDIRKYKTTVMGPFSIRQTILIGVVVFIDISLYSLVRDTISLDNCRSLIWAYFFIDVPILAFSFEPQGVSMEKFLKQIIYYNFLLPAKRKAKTAVSKRKKYNITRKEEKAITKKIASLTRTHPEFKSYQ